MGKIHLQVIQAVQCDQTLSPIWRLVEVINHMTPRNPETPKVHGFCGDITVPTQTSCMY